VIKRQLCIVKKKKTLVYGARQSLIFHFLNSCYLSKIKGAKKHNPPVLKGKRYIHLKIGREIIKAWSRIVSL